MRHHEHAIIVTVPGHQLRARVGSLVGLLILFPEQITSVFGELSAINPLFILVVYAPAIDWIKIDRNFLLDAEAMTVALLAKTGRQRRTG